MDSRILSIINKRKQLKWSKKLLAEKAEVPHSAILRMEKGGEDIWPDYLSRIEYILDSELERALNYKLKQINTNYLTANKVESVSSKYQVCIDSIDIKTYFPNLDRGQIKFLFGDRRKDVNQENDKKLALIKYRKYRKVDNRLQEALDHANVLSTSFPTKKKKIFSNNKFSPNFNVLACRWFEEFDNVNNTKGLHATSEGEYYIKELGFFPDYFNPQIKLIIEWDESYHYTKKGELSQKDIARQKAIQELFPDYEFIRIKEEDFKEYLDL